MPVDRDFILEDYHCQPETSPQVLVDGAKLALKTSSLVFSRLLAALKMSNE